MQNFEKIKQALDLMGKVIPKYVRKKMDAKYKDQAFSTACETFGKNSVVRKALEQKGWINGIDLYAGLQIIRKQQFLFEEEMGGNAWSYCLRVLFYRNMVAHPVPADVKKLNEDSKIDVYLDEMSAFMQPIHPETAKKIELLKTNAPEAAVPKKQEPEKQYPVLQDTPSTVQLRLGERRELSGSFSMTEKLLVHLKVDGKGMYRFACFGLNETGILADPQYIIWEEAPSSPDKAVTYLRRGKEVFYSIDLEAIPAAIETLSFTISIENGENSAMNDITSYTAAIGQNGNKVLTFMQQGTDFDARNAITSVISVQLYRKNGSWRVQAVGNGFIKNFEELKQFFATKRS